MIRDSRGRVNFSRNRKSTRCEAGVPSQLRGEVLTSFESVAIFPPSSFKDDMMSFAPYSHLSTLHLARF